MPRATRAGSMRNDTESAVRRAVEWLFHTMYERVGVMLIAFVAAGIAIYAFTVSFGEGVRAVIFFIIPSLWGAFALATFDGQPTALERFGQSAMIGVGLVAGIVLSALFVFEAPIAIANLALGLMEAFFFLMWIGNQQSAFGRIEISSRAQPWGVAFLIMVTVLSITIAVSV
jgi:hypothetical protein